MKTFVVAVSFLMLLAIQSFGQLVPLELTNTIPLPTSSAVWDVMPHPDGYYLWVQATEPQNEQTRIYFGRSDSSRVDSIDLAVGTPQSITCFWRGDYEPCVVLASRYIAGYYDSTLFRIYRLADGVPDSVLFCWPSGETSIPFPKTWGNFQLGVAAPWPPPPAVSMRVPSWISYGSHFEWHGMGHWSTTDEYVAFAIPDMLIEQPSNHYLSDLDETACFFSWAATDSGIVAGYSGRYESAGDQAHSFMAMVCQSRMLQDTALLFGCFYRNASPDNLGRWTIGPTATTYDTVQHAALSFTCLGTLYGIVSSASSQQYLWTTPGPYSTMLAAEVVAENTAEEFLCYRTDRPTFDVFDATTGYRYGETDSIVIATDAGARIVGRYDSTSRRLAFRDGNQLKLLRFGEYLEVGRRPTEVESFALSCYPNPFNPTTTISFTLPRAGNVKLAVFDITGRLAQTITDERFEAGEHAVKFDSRGLASGIYFARMQAGSFEKTAKMLLIR
jgi:hypothetical protein